MMFLIPTSEQRGRSCAGGISARYISLPDARFAPFVERTDRRKEGIRLRILLFLFCVTLFLASTLAGQENPPTPYAINVVRSALRARSDGHKFILSQTAKSVARLGDCVSIALLKILENRDLTNPDKVRDFLPIVRDAFSHPEIISIEADKNPKVTLFLLSYMLENTPDAQTQHEIQQAMDFVRNKTQ